MGIVPNRALVPKGLSCTEGVLFGTVYCYGMYRTDLVWEWYDEILSQRIKRTQLNTGRAKRGVAGRCYAIIAQ
jgi:hypothetical protein